MRWFAARCGSSTRKCRPVPRTTFNLGQMEGGTSVNSIPHEAQLKVDMRRKAKTKLSAWKLRSANAWPPACATRWKTPATAPRANWNGRSNVIGSRPGGELAAGFAAARRFARRGRIRRQSVAHRAFFHRREHSAVPGNRCHLDWRGRKWRRRAFAAGVVRASGTRKRV